jgi:hypothetical protein
LPLNAHFVSEVPPFGSSSDPIHLQSMACDRGMSVRERTQVRLEHFAVNISTASAD